MKRFKRTFAAFLAVLLILSTFGVYAYAGDHENQVHVIVENTTFPKTSGAPWDGVLVEEWVTIDNNSTMMSCVVAALAIDGHSQEGAESNYISEIDGLAAFAGGTESGWMGTLNDWFTNEGFSAFTVADGKLEAGDEIRIMYTTEGYGEDLGGSWSNNDNTVKDISFSAGTLDKTFDKEAHSYTLTVPSGTTGIVLTPTASNKNFLVKTFVGENEYKRTEEIPVSDETIIKVECGNPEWPSMNTAAESQVYTITVKEASSIKLGDVNGDGNINSTDALLILKGSTGSTTLSEEQKLRADVNGDKGINSTDALLVLKYSTGKITVFPASV